MDVYANLAMEEYLLDQSDLGLPILFLWQSEQAVVMGKNQNPWLECNVEAIAEDKVPLARRISGGGTVYHDQGNLNYAFIVDRVGYKEQEQYDFVIAFLRHIGIETLRSGPSNINVGDKKISGNAYCIRKDRVLHHGTLLIDTDLSLLEKYLQSEEQPIVSHSVRSIPARVMNLKDAVPGIRMEQVIMDCIAYALNQGGVVLNEAELHIPSELRDKFAHEDCIYGLTPRFKFTQGETELEVVKGKVLRNGRMEYWKGGGLVGEGSDIKEP